MTRPGWSAPEPPRSTAAGPRRRSTGLPAAAALVVLAALAGCASTITGVRVAHPPDGVAPPPAGAHVEMHYLGNGGWLIRRGDDVLATAPFVSNPIGPAIYLPAEPDRDRIRAQVPEMRDVAIMLIGHAHYDHAMDLPEIMATKAGPATTLYGSTTVKRLLGKAITDDRAGADRVIDVTDAAAKGTAKGAWRPIGHDRIRFMPLASTHAPHLLRSVKVVSWGRLDRDLETSELPTVPAAWPEGETLAFLVDFLGHDRQTVEFRVYYQDAAAHRGTGVIPELDPPDRVPVDVAILCVAAFDQVPDNPESILRNVKPRHVVGGHWEDFFLSRTADGQPPRSAFGTSLDAFVERVHRVARVPVYLPAPGQKLYIPVAPR